MKYKGIELTEITSPNIDNLPKKMLVWNDDFNNPIERVVCATAIDNCGGLFFIVRNENEQLKGIAPLLHCAEIPETKTRRATNRELSRWLAEGKGDVLTLMQTANRHSREMVETSWHYFSGESSEDVDYGFTGQRCKGVRKWGDTEWHEPTAEYMGIE